MHVKFTQINSNQKKRNDISENVHCQLYETMKECSHITKFSPLFSLIKKLVA